MDDLMTMREGERLSTCAAIERASSIGSPLFVRARRAARYAFKQLITRNAALVIADVVQRADVRMREGRDTPRFALEALTADRIAAQFGVEHLMATCVTVHSALIDVTIPRRSGASISYGEASAWEVRHFTVSMTGRGIYDSDQSAWCVMTMQ